MAGKKTGQKKEKKGCPAQKTKTDADTDVGKQAIQISEQAKARKKLKKEKLLQKKQAEEVEDVEEAGSEEECETKPLPTVHTDGKLANIVEKSQKAEKLKDSESSAFLSIATPSDDRKEETVVSGNKKKIGSNRAVVYISHIPHGFYEKAMRQFFGQFGTVTNLRLGRSKKTGKSCGFAFVEFKYIEVAKVVVESMNNYLMFDRLLKCSLVPKERQSMAIFKGKIKENRPPLMISRMKAKRLHNSVKCEETVQKRQVRQIKQVKSKLAKLRKAGIDYNFQIAEMIK